MSDRCCACGTGPLRPHLRVGGDIGAQGLIPSTDAFGTALADLVRCATCGHGQLESMPTDVDLAAAYGAAESAAYVAEETGQRATARRTLARIEAHAPRSALLDLGCWVGFLLAEARTRGWETLGIEPSAFASAYARDTLSLDVRTTDLWSDEAPAGHFGAVVLGDVIEHLPRPDEALERIASRLVADGVVAMTLPDSGSRVARALGRRWWSVIPTHVQYFTRGSVTRLLERRGWTVLEIDTAPKAFTVGYYLDRVGGYSPPVSRALVGAATRAGLAQRMWAPDFRDRMLVIARRPG